MTSVTYGKCYLWQKYYVKYNYGKNIMANETEPLTVIHSVQCTCSISNIANYSFFAKARSKRM